MLIRFICLLVSLLFCSIPVIAAEDNHYKAQHVVYTLDSTMNYNCTLFYNDWPDIIKSDMEKCFAGVEAILKGIHCDWHPVAGDDMTYVFSVCKTNDQLLLVGAIKEENGWNSQIISDHFFRMNTPFDIAMKPTLHADGTTSYYCPSIKYDDEWFCFIPTNRGFLFDYYERGTDVNDESEEDVRLVIKLYDSLPMQTIEVSHMLSGSKTLVFRGFLSETEQISEIDASTFPTDIQTVQALCEPNG